MRMESRTREASPRRYEKKRRKRKVRLMVELSSRRHLAQYRAMHDHHPGIRKHLHHHYHRRHNKLSNQKLVLYKPKNPRLRILLLRHSLPRQLACQQHRQHQHRHRQRHRRSSSDPSQERSLHLRHRPLRSAVVPWTSRTLRSGARLHL